jgi:putative inorganic carbon (hco3(-)) transporter
MGFLWLWPMAWLSGVWLGLGLLYGWATRQMPLTPLRFPLLLLTGLSVLSVTLVTADMEPTLRGAGVLWQGLAGYVLGLLWLTTAVYQKRFAFALILFGIGLSLVAPVLVVWLDSKILIIPTAVYHIIPTLATNTVHPNTLASALLLLLPLPLAILLTPQQPRTATWYFACTAVVIMGLMFILTQSRAGYLALTLSLLFLLYLTQWRKLSYTLSALLLITLPLLLFLSYNTSTTTSTLTNATDTNTLQFRLQVWGQALQLIADFPFTGVGIGAFNLVSQRLYPFPTLKDLGAHNLYLAIGTELGIIALIAYIALLLNLCLMATQLIRSSYQPAKRLDEQLKPLIYGTTTGLLALHLHGLLDNTLWSTRLGFLPWLLIALLTAIYLTHPPIHPSTHPPTNTP